MDYQELAAELMENIHAINKARPPHMQINESMRGESFVIQYLSHHKGSVLPSEISNIMGISSARIAVALNHLEQKGLITRRIDIGDRRRILVDLTQEGKTSAEKEHQMIEERLIKMLSSLGEQDAGEFVRILGKLAKFTSPLSETD